jgi:hypothetical protein
LFEKEKKRLKAVKRHTEVMLACKEEACVTMLKMKKFWREEEPSRTSGGWLRRRLAGATSPVEEPITRLEDHVPATLQQDRLTLVGLVGERVVARVVAGRL